MHQRRCSAVGSLDLAPSTSQSDSCSPENHKHPMLQQLVLQHTYMNRYVSMQVTYCMVSSKARLDFQGARFLQLLYSCCGLCCHMQQHAGHFLTVYLSSLSAVSAPGGSGRIQCSSKCHSLSSANAVWQDWWLQKLVSKSMFPSVPCHWGCVTVCKDKASPE